MNILQILVLISLIYGFWQKHICNSLQRFFFLLYEQKNISWNITVLILICKDFSNTINDIQRSCKIINSLAQKYSGNLGLLVLFCSYLTRGIQHSILKLWIRMIHDFSDQFFWIWFVYYFFDYKHSYWLKNCK